MVAPNAEGTSLAPKAPEHPRKSGIRAALEYTGIPTSWLSKRPKLPSRNWLIFLTFTSSLTGLYVYDRRECKRIRREYVDRVKHLAEEPLGSLDWPRKVTVYGCKWPGDEEHDRSMKYFRKYVKVCPCISSDVPLTFFSRLTTVELF
jgi:import inner membrane translocase subunit TIM54